VATQAESSVLQTAMSSTTLLLAATRFAKNSCVASLIRPIFSSNKITKTAFPSTPASASFPEKMLDLTHHGIVNGYPKY
jgi:hypothetical protein